MDVIPVVEENVWGKATQGEPGNVMNDDSLLLLLRILSKGREVARVGASLCNEEDSWLGLSKRHKTGGAIRVPVRALKLGTLTRWARDGSRACIRGYTEKRRRVLLCL